MGDASPCNDVSSDVIYVKHAARVAAELGVDIVKTNYTGSIETFREVTEGCGAPVVIAGGPKSDSFKDVLQIIADSIEAGGVGVAMGRNVWQSKNPVITVKAIARIVHDNWSVEETFREYESSLK